MPRFIFILLAIPATIICLMGLGFVVSQVQLSGKIFPPSNSEPNWQMLTKEEVPSIVTTDANGDKRITQLWIISMDNTAYLRTGNTKWFANLERVPELELRIGGVMYPCRTSVVSDDAKVQEAHETFYAKYPRRSDFFRIIGISTNTVIALKCNFQN